MVLYYLFSWLYVYIHIPLLFSFHICLYTLLIKIHTLVCWLQITLLRDVALLIHGIHFLEEFSTYIWHSKSFLAYMGITVYNTTESFRLRKLQILLSPCSIYTS
jgi:hypothetical protein